MRARQRRNLTVIVLLTPMLCVMRPGKVDATGLTYTVALGGTATCSSGQQVGVDFGTIQAALDCATQNAPAASNLDTISIAAGTYLEHLTVNANVVLLGASGGTVVDGSRSGSVVTVNDPFILDVTNLTITHGNASRGGGIDNRGTLKLSSSTVRDNVAGAGAGIFNDVSTAATISESTINNNTATGNGGGIFAGPIMTISNSAVSDNHAATGGGIYSQFDTSVMSTSISDNAALYGDGGIENLDGTMLLRASTVTDNSAEGGGGIQSSGTLTLSDATVNHNFAANGGGIFTDNSLTLIRSTVSHNFTPVSAGGGDGGGIYNQGTVTLSASTVRDNSAQRGGGIFGHNAALSKSIVSDNVAVIGGGIFDEGTTTLSDSAVVRNTASAGTGSGVYNLGWITLANSVVSRNRPPDDQCDGC